MIDYFVNNPVLFMGLGMGISAILFSLGLLVDDMVSKNSIIDDLHTSIMFLSICFIVITLFLLVILFPMTLVFAAPAYVAFIANRHYTRKREFMEKLQGV